MNRKTKTQNPSGKKKATQIVDLKLCILKNQKFKKKGGFMLNTNDLKTKREEKTTNREKIENFT